MTDLVKRHMQWKSNKELCREPTGEFVLEAKDTGQRLDKILLQ